ncbi:MAG: presqualene diphosphate synthase HpnD [Solirubrobacteraceae bacterium]
MSAPASIQLADAYRHCEQLTRSEAANFYYGIRLLPAAKRRAMCAVYALARQIDDIGDETPPREDPLAELDAIAETVRAVRNGARGTDPVSRALADSAARFPIPLDAFLELIEGVRSDVLGASYETEEQLVRYCRRVAGTIGRLCLGIFGSSELERAMGLADDLGVAMQLTNILRDVREDAAHGRVYLPAADLRRVGWAGEGPIAAPELLARIGRSGGAAPEGTVELIAIEAARAHAWFARGMALVPLLDRRSQACVQAMTGIYRRLLGRIEAHPEEVLRRRLALNGWEKAWVAASSAIGSAT